MPLSHTETLLNTRDFIEVGHGKWASTNQTLHVTLH